jgi:transposase-like protein
VIRQTVLRGIEQGEFHPKEARVLAELFSLLEGRDELAKGGERRSCFPVEAPSKPQEQEQEQRSANDGERDDGPAAAAAEKGATLSEVEEERGCVNAERSGHAERCIRPGERVAAAGIQAIREEPAAAGIQTLQAACVQALLTPHAPISDLPEPVVDMVTSAAMYDSNASLSRIGRWLGGKAKSTSYNWVIGVAFALWPVIQGWVWQEGKATRVYVDEQWLNIRKRWHSWFVAVDQKTGLPCFRDLLPTRSKWAGRLFVLKLNRLGKAPSQIMTDGLQGYLSAIARVLPRAKPLLGLFHHQQPVTRCVKEPFPETDQEAATEAKTRMKQGGQSDDTRTVKRRLDAVEQRAEQQGWTITNWMKRTRKILPKLLPGRGGQIRIRAQRTKVNAFSESLTGSIKPVADVTRSHVPGEKSWSFW